MSTLNLTRNSSNNLVCQIFDNTTNKCLSHQQYVLSPSTSSQTDIMSLSSFEIIFIAACSSFMTLIFAGLFNLLKLNIKQEESQWKPPPPPNFDAIIQETKQSYIKQAKQRENSQHLLNSQSASLITSNFPPQNRYYPIVSSAYKLFLEAINGTERDGWIYQGEKKGVKKYRRDVHNSPFSLFRGEKILNYPQNILIHAIRDKRIRLLVGDGQMKDCGPLEIIDENCKIEFEEYKSPAPFVGAREFVYIDCIHRLHDDTILSFARSVSHPARPKTNKFTRADLKIGGWALKKIPDEPNKTKVLYLVRCDLGGSVPSWVVNQITSDIPITVERLNASIQKLGNIQQFDKPLMDVLLYGPRSPKVGGNNDENKDDDGKYDNDGGHGIMGNGVSTMTANKGYKFPEMTEIQKQRIAKILRENKDFWSSKDYLDLIPKNDPNWIKRRPKLIGGSVEEHEALLDSFVIPDKPFKYKPDIEEAFRLFNKWRKWKNNDEINGWKFKAQKEDMKIYSRSVSGEAIDIIKGEAIIPFTTPIIAGVLLNPEHRQKWDGKLDEVMKVSKSSKYSSIIYLSVKTPTVFITYRDMIAITFVYPFPDGSILMGSRSIKHEQHPPKKTRVRAHINLDMWHIRPFYEKNIMYSKVTHYAHVSLGGSLPTWIVNEASVDMPSGILKVRQYIKNIYNNLHKPGMLNIPPYPFLKSLNINIGWMDPFPTGEIYDDNDDNKTEKKDIETPKESQQKMLIEEEELQQDENKNNDNIDNQPVIVSNIKSPALNYVKDRQRTLSNHDITKEDNKGSSSVTSSRKRHKPNDNLAVANPTIYSGGSSGSNTKGGGGGSTLTGNTTKGRIKNNKNQIIITRSMWEKGQKLRLKEIKVKNAAMSSMTKLIKKQSSRIQPLPDDEEKGEQDNNDDEEANDDDDEGDNDYKYDLLSELSVRDSASYMTLANYAVSELLNQTDPSSKEYWVPSDAKTPRGIFVYKFIHSREKYYHYMGKAILHHEPKFIYEALCDPTFRYEYDKMLDELQIIDKLDDNTYIARYLHTNKQCYIKQQRETICVIRHRCVCPNDKFVAAGMSIEHELHPTEIGMKTFKQIERQKSHSSASESNNNDGNVSDIGNISKQLSGKGPSKSMSSGILRIDIKSSGWVIERNVKKPTDSIVSYITNINFGGSVPSALLKSIAKKQPLAIFYLGKALKARYKKIKQQKKALKAQRLQQQMLKQQQNQFQDNQQQA